MLRREQRVVMLAKDAAQGKDYGSSIFILNIEDWLSFI